MRRYKTTGNTTLFDKEDTEHKLILTQEVTPASVHDSQPMDTLLVESNKGQPLFADSAYVGQEETLEKYHVKDKICEKGYRGHPLTEEQRETNREKSRTRSRVEQIVRLNLIETKN
jgi:IS5 family transposase